MSIGLLSGLSIVLPTSLGALWPAGPRLFPFALILLASSLSWPPRYHKLLALGMLVIVSGLSFANSLKARELDREFRIFLSGTQHVALGSKVLPILVDPFEGARSVSPFWSLAAAYTIARGGADPTVKPRL